MPVSINRSLVLLSFICALSFGSGRAAASPELPDASSQNPVQIHGESVEYFHEEQKAVGTGHVTIDYEGTRLEADKITVYTATKKAVAEGHVTLIQEGSTFRGEKAEYDFAAKKGNVDKMDVEMEKTYYGRAQRVERVGENHFRVSNSTLTTCCCTEDPFYKIQAQSVDYYPGDKVVMKNAVMFVKNMPILFIPYFEQPFVDFDRFPVHLVPGSRDEWGPFLLSKWRYNVVNRPDLKVKGNVQLDYRAKRGFGGGTEAFYSGDAVGRGVARAYYASDDKAPENVNDDRSRYQWRHQSKLAESTTLTAEINKLSDPFVTKDFFYHEEYEQDVVPDNYVSIITSKPEYTFSVMDRFRMNDFFDSTERNPDIRFDTHNRAFGDTPFYLRAENQFTNFQRTPAESEEEIDAMRMDNNYTLSYAGKVGALSVVPRIGTRQTYYSRRATDDHDLWRGMFDPGLDLSIHFYKTYGAYWKAMGLDINQIRHIFTPTASYNYRHNPTVSRTLLSQFDALDGLDKENFIRLNFENKFQTKPSLKDGSLGQPRDLARIIPYLDVDLHSGHLENVGVDAELRPYTWLGMEMDATYEPDSRDIDTANFDVFWELGRWRVGVGQRYLQEESSQTTLDIRLKWSDEWEFKLYERFEFDDGDSKEFEITASKIWDCVITDLTYNRREGDTIFLTIRLKAFPSTPFTLSQSYDHPKSAARDL